MFSVPETIQDAIAMKRLWIHEILRVYYDRLVDESDCSWFFDRLCFVCKEFLNESINDIFVNFTNGQSENVHLININLLTTNTIKILFINRLANMNYDN